MATVIDRHAAHEETRKTAVMFDAQYSGSLQGSLPFERDGAPASALSSLRKALRPGESMLSLGAGRALREEEFARSGVLVTAVDLSQEAIGQAGIRMMASRVKGLTLVHADMREYRIEGQFDAVISISALQYLDPEDMEAVVRKMMRHTKPGGTDLIVIVSDILSGNEFRDMMGHLYRPPKWDMHYYMHDAVCQFDRFEVAQARRN